MRRWRNSFSAAGAAIACGGVLVLGTASPAGATTQQYANAWLGWEFATPGAAMWNVDQVFSVDQPAPSSSWAANFNFNAGQNGYAGLQTDGRRFDGSTGSVATFSIWGSTGARWSSPATCSRFPPESGGTGYGCHLAYDFAPGTDYRLRLWRLEHDGVGQWWTVWIQDTRTGVDTRIGDLRANAASGQVVTRWDNVSDYHGEQVPCNAVPASVVSFTQPAGNQLAPGTYQFGSHYRADSFRRGECTGASHGTDVSTTDPRVRITLGG